MLIFQYTLSYTAMAGIPWGSNTEVNLSLLFSSLLLPSPTLGEMSSGAAGRKGCMRRVRTCGSAPKLLRDGEVTRGRDPRLTRRSSGGKRGPHCGKHSVAASIFKDG